MGRKRLPPDHPREWISRAKSNLAMSRHTDPDVDLEDLCFEAQQAAEKGIKAVFIKRGQRFPFSHDLERLLRLLELNGLKIPKYVHESWELTQYAHERCQGGSAGGLRRPVRQQQVIGSFGIQLRGDVLERARIAADTVETPTRTLPHPWGEGREGGDVLAGRNLPGGNSNSQEPNSRF